MAYTHIGSRPGDEVELESAILKVLAECAGTAVTDSTRAAQTPAGSASPAAEGATPSAIAKELSRRLGLSRQDAYRLLTR